MSTKTERSVIRTTGGLTYVTDSPVEHTVIGIGDMNIPAVKLLVIPTRNTATNSAGVEFKFPSCMEIYREILIPVTAIQAIETSITEN
jgi:hypothetical protein